MKPEDELLKIKAESEYWFSRWQLIDKSYGDLQRDRDLVNACWIESRDTAISQSNRLDLITKLQKASAETGYITPYHMGGVTEQCLQEEIKKAQNFRSPIVQYPGGSIDFQRPPLRNSRETREYMDQLEQAIRKTLTAGRK